MLLLVISTIIMIVSMIAWKFQALSNSGAIAATFVGIAIYLGFGWRGLILLGLFFVSSSFWSLYKSGAKKAIEEKLEKGSKRDWLQVMANGGIAALSGLLFYISNDTVWTIAFLTSIASATGDTWSSEIGPLSKRPPITVRGFKTVEAGTSGAISLLGTIGAFAGVGFIVLWGYFLMPISVKIASIIMIFGIVGNVIDTFLGAFFQRSFRCEICLIETEKAVHCGRKTNKIRGYVYLNNDGVNLLSSLLAPILAILTYRII